MERVEMPLMVHLSELRKRMLISVAFLGAAFIVLFNISERIFDLLVFPLNTELKIISAKPFLKLIAKKPVSLVFLSPAEGFWMHLKISMVAAAVVSLPVIFFQLWRFIGPGLVDKEKKYVIPFVVTSTFLFLMGAAFCFIIILPFALTFLLGYKTEHMTPVLAVGSYTDFCLKFILAFGAIFELPLIILFLARADIVSPAALARHRRYAILGAFIGGAILTPTPDAFNQILMSIPIIVLYEIGIVLARFTARRERSKERA
ncbi:MAG: twin-arginine translocase subunit TatC [Nitrospirae bacterium]|nr:twin-arginine translocase subunit TatC [Nitrospirota bacterium]